MRQIGSYRTLWQVSSPLQSGIASGRVLTEHRRPHPRRACELLLLLAEEAGWEIEDRGANLFLSCPCAEDHHWGWVDFQPRDPNHARVVLDIIGQCAKWKGGSMIFEVVFEGLVRSGTPEKVPPPDEIRAVLNRLMDELPKHGADSPGIDCTTSTGRVRIRVTVEAKEPDEALQRGGTQIRASAHAAEIGTPGWQIHWCRVQADIPQDSQRDRIPA